MAKLELYKSFFNYKSLKDIQDGFKDSLLSTNRTYEFFVNWEKVKANIQNFKIEIGILGTLVNSKNFEKDLEEILIKYPHTAKVLPLIIAVRDPKFVVLEDVDNGGVYAFDFSKQLTKNEIKKLVHFTKKSGIADLFKVIKVLNDYLMGVEVGLDSNARKNRSGDFMVDIIEQSLLEIQKSFKDLEIFNKSKFSTLAEKYNVQIPEGLKYRTPDFTIRKGKNLVSIEVNFYMGQGSKPQEIVDSYINRQRELKNNGWNFVWITDGYGWNAGQNQITKAIEEMDFVLNINFVKKGFLKYIIENL